MTQSINQNQQADTLPDFRNQGVMLRIVLLVNGAALAEALLQATSWGDVAQRFLSISALLQPILLSTLLLLFALVAVLSRLPYRQGVAVVALLVAIVTLAIFKLGGQLYESPVESGSFSSWRYALLGAGTTALLLTYFKLRTLALSPALHKARLQALQARIRPHFLFNSINAVLGIVRANPKRAETALEDMSDLFRMAMALDSDLVPVRQEMALAKQYLALEQLRLGERLKVNWHTENIPEDALIPPLVLQPLLENAVYHGIEPLAQGGEIDVRLYRKEKEINLEMFNPRLDQASRHIGNKIALANIRERLALQFDIEAQYTVETGKDFYRVHITFPYVKESS